MDGGDRKPLVSVVLPTLNGRRYIAESIQSCLAQTYRQFELIVVDDGSTDDTANVVHTFDDPRVRLLQLGENVGLPRALNVGFAEARGEYYTFTSDDNLYAPDAFATLVTALEQHQEAGLVYAGQFLIGADGRVLRAANHFPPETLGSRNPIGGCFMYRRSVAEAVGGYDSRFHMAEDAHYWMRISRQAEILQLPGRHYYYRLHEESLTGRGYGAYEAQRAVERARRDVLGARRGEHRARLASFWVEEALAASHRRDLGHARGALLRGVLLNPGQLASRRLVRIALASLRPASSRRSAPLQSP